jgi:hypothetical protein
VIKFTRFPCRSRQILDGILEVGFPAVDRYNAGTALGEKPQGCGSDDAGRAGDDGDLAIQTYSIGHFRKVSFASSGYVRTYCWFPRGAVRHSPANYFMGRAG